MAQQVSVASIINPDKQGFMTKQGGMFKNWKRRWFILKGTDLYYFRDKSDTAPAGVIKIEGSLVSNADKHTGKKDCIELTTRDNNRTYYMFPDSHVEYESWVNALVRATEHKDRQARPTTAPVEKTTHTLFIRGMGLECKCCDSKVRNVLSKAAGVQSFDLNSDEEIAVIKAGAGLDLPSLVNILEDYGFIVSVS
eukprot:TRINITY_DN5572_c0_g1_i1.p1 TRINITY_DN5572_c0_g1~~TRINITY_DN5572_c0_g1_i1.p1  ORF type:complete len:195 (+),score=28.29 TRINITY_DN5572_c0_g1_i1:93-677(+)